MAARDVAKASVHCFGQGFVEVQERVRDERPRRLFRGVDAGDRVALDRARGRLGILPEPFELPRVRGDDPLDFVGFRRAGRDEAEGVRARGVGRPARAGASRNTRAASARAASKYASSFSVVSACSGVLVRTRRTIACSRLVASNVMKLG